MVFSRLNSYKVFIYCVSSPHRIDWTKQDPIASSYASFSRRNGKMRKRKRNGYTAKVDPFHSLILPAARWFPPFPFSYPHEFSNWRKSTRATTPTLTSYPSLNTYWYISHSDSKLFIFTKFVLFTITTTHHSLNVISCFLVWWQWQWHYVFYFISAIFFPLLYFVNPEVYNFIV
jgi:hypothetical protein